jgi:DNA-directed RNA polymerase subunit RPC12/RpoP
MAAAYAGVCMMCGRTVGYAVEGAFYTTPGGPRPERQGRHLRCGHCQGAIIFEPDAMLPPDWIAQLRRDEAASMQPRREARRRAV